MGVGMWFQAIPEESRLFERLRSEQALGFIFAAFFPLGSGPFQIRHLDEDEVEEVFERIEEESSGLFHSRDDVRRAWNDLLGEIARAEADFPGLATRVAFLDKTALDIEAAIKKTLKPMGKLPADDLIDQTMYGGLALTTGLDLKGDLGVYWRQSSLVKRSASLLRGVELDASGLEYDHARENYKNLRDAFLAAADHGEGMLNGLT